MDELRPMLSCGRPVDNAGRNSRGILPGSASGRLSRIFDYGDDRCSRIRRHSLDAILVIDPLPRSVAITNLWTGTVFAPLGCHPTS